MFNTSGSGYSLADIAAATGTRNNDGLFGDSGWWIILLFLFAGWGRGFGGFGGAEGGMPVGFCATKEDVRAAVDQQTLISKLDQQTYGLADSTYALSNAITSGFHGVDNAICTLGYQTQASFAGLGAQIAQCCCDTRAAIADVKYANERNACDIIRAGQDNTRAILDFLTQDKIATLTAENQSLKFAASQQAQNAFIIANQEAQTAELIRRLGRDCPVPAYVVPNPNCCYNPCNC